MRRRTFLASFLGLLGGLLMPVRVQMGKLPSGDYGLRVVGPDGSTVIIDGTSNMFKILATGTQDTGSIATDSTASVSVTLTALGTFSTTPAHISFLANGTTSAANQHLGYFLTNVSEKWVSGSNGGATDQDVVIPNRLAEAHSSLDGSSQAVVTVAGWNRASTDVTYYHRYYVLQETAL